MLYCFIGWIYEVILEFSYGNGFINRGFLHGPYLPVYGFGALLILLTIRPFSKKKIYLKNPIRLLIAFLVVILMSAGFMLLFMSPVSGDSIPEYTTIVVARGDTLWGIARSVARENENIRNKINEIKELNDISSDLRIGQELKIRVN